MKENILTMPGCGTCEAVKKITKKKVKTVSIGTKKGVKIANQIKASKYPQCFTITKKGKAKKCDTNKFLKKWKIRIS